MRDETYEEFIEKFKPKKTTDDCYTPPEIYEVVKKYVCKRYSIRENDIVRPFYPGGDYENFAYQEGCVVLDNPPFSILKKICDFYCDKDIKFFLFAPTLTIFSAIKRQSINCIVCDCAIVYENGAKVNTSFLTNLGHDDIVAESNSELTKIVNDKTRELKNKKIKTLPKYKYPDYVLTAAVLKDMSKYGIDYAVKSKEARFTRALDAQKPYKKSIYGAGLLLSEKKMVEKKIAEKKMAEKKIAEKNEVTIWELSDREKELITRLA